MSRSSIIAIHTLVLVLCTSGCVFSPAGPIFLKSEGKGEEYELIGVVNGIWRYDEEQNHDRLRRFLPSEDATEIAELADRYQVRVGFKRGILGGGSAVDVALLPEGWTHTTTNNAKSETEVQPGDVVLALVQRGRLVDKVIAIHRRCDDAPTKEELKEHSIGCFEITDFGERGYGGKRYYFSVF